MTVLLVDGNVIVFTGVVDAPIEKPNLAGGVAVVVLAVEVGNTIVVTGIVPPIVPIPLVEGVVVPPTVGIGGVIGATILGIIVAIEVGFAGVTPVSVPTFEITGGVTTVGETRDGAAVGIRLSRFKDDGGV